MSISRRLYASELTRELIGKKVKVAGWIEDIRPLGSILFMVVRDASGMAQLVFREDQLPKEIMDRARHAPKQSIVEAEGITTESRAKELPVEVACSSFSVISEAVHPLPIDPTGRVPSSPDLRLDSRALDLRNPSVLAMAKIRHVVLQSIRKFLSDSGFIEVQTSKIIGQAAEGGATLFSIDYFGRTAYLAQSPQLYKEQLTLSLERVFEIANYFRAERSHTRRHLNEFTMVDVEAAYFDENDAMSLAERMIYRALEDVNTLCRSLLSTIGKEPSLPLLPFPKISYSEALAELASKGIVLETGEDLSDAALKVLGEDRGYFFIVDWPEKLKPFYIEPKPDGASRGFDLQFGPLEIASGGKRVSSRAELERRIAAAGLDVKSFEGHLKAFDWGIPPHSGWGFGLDRFLMAIAGADNIREVILYPRDQFRLTP